MKCQHIFNIKSSPSVSHFLIKTATVTVHRTLLNFVTDVFIIVFWSTCTKTCMPADQNLWLQQNWTSRKMFPWRKVFGNSCKFSRKRMIRNISKSSFSRNFEKCGLAGLHSTSWNVIKNELLTKLSKVLKILDNFQEELCNGALF